MKYLILLLAVLAYSCKETISSKVDTADPAVAGVELIILGTVQDGGAPHIGCVKSCCAKLWDAPDESLKVVSLGVIDRDDDKVYLFEATPDFPEQIAKLNELAGRPISQMPDGIFITHAHIGHYTGLMFLGREAKGAKNVPVYAMPKLRSFLSTNGPWDQLVNLNNIQLIPTENKGVSTLSKHLRVFPFTVPHRDEYSETVGFVIEGPKNKVLFIPDIDKWDKWEEDIIAKIKEVDLAFLDATFFDAQEINNRDIKEIPHPFVIESMDLFKSLEESDKKKVHFIHLNHTNPLLNKKSKAYQTVKEKGFSIAEFGKKAVI